MFKRSFQLIISPGKLALSRKSHSCFHSSSYFFFLMEESIRKVFEMIQISEFPQWRARYSWYTHFYGLVESTMNFIVFD